jgi:hypothetical protein
MREDRPINNKFQFRKAIRPLAFTFIICCIFYYLFGPWGPIFQYLNTDLSFLILPFFGYWILRLFSRLIRIARPSRDGTAYALILNGAAWAFFSFFLFNRAPLLVRIPDLVQFQWLLFEIRHSGPFAVLFFTGYTITRLSGLLKNNIAGSPKYPAVLASGQIIMGYSLWQAFATFSQYWAPINGVGLVFLAGLLALAVSALGEYGKYSGQPLLADASSWLNKGPVGKFFFGILIAAYFIFIRPAIVAATPWAYVIEWLIVCFIAWRIFSAVKRSLDNNYSLPFKETAWQSQRQEINELVSDDFNNLVKLQENFVDQSATGIMVSSLRHTLRNNYLDENEINQVLAMILEYRDRQIPWYAFGFWRRRILKRNRQNREQVLKSTITMMGSLVHPANKTGG